MASGGCTALELAGARPDVGLSLIDANPAQLDHVAAKWAALWDSAPGSVARRRAFGVDADDPESLSGAGNFEALFRGLRRVLDDLAMSAGDRRAVLEGRLPVEALTARFHVAHRDLLVERRQSGSKGRRGVPLHQDQVRGELLKLSLQPLQRRAGDVGQGLLGGHQGQVMIGLQVKQVHHLGHHLPVLDGQPPPRGVVKGQLGGQDNQLEQDPDAEGLRCRWQTCGS